MNFSYRFPAVKGIQAGREYYISMVPLKLLPRLFPSDEEFVLPEFRAQRRINESRIPEITRYIIDNRDSYVFSALSASCCRRSPSCPRKAKTRPAFRCTCQNPFPAL